MEPLVIRSPVPHGLPHGQENLRVDWLAVRVYLSTDSTHDTGCSMLVAGYWMSKIRLWRAGYWMIDVLWLSLVIGIVFTPNSVHSVIRIPKSQRWVYPIPALQTELFSGDAYGRHKRIKVVVFNRVCLDLFSNPGLKILQLFNGGDIP